MTNFVQQYRSTDLNAPPLSGQAGALLKVLNAVLVDGYGYSGISITGITRSGTTATATVSAADGLRLRTGMILTISGAAQSDYNITATITVASTTTFTYTVANSPTTPATGTIVCSTFLPITSITRVGTTATVQLANANTTLVVGNYVTISGAVETAYNGTVLITAVPDSTHFTYTVAGSPSTPASGTIVYAKAGLGWTRPFAGGTNKQSYRSADASSNQLYLQVNDNAATAGGAKEAAVYGAEILTADDTPNNGGGANTGRFPTTTQLTNGVCWFKSASADTVLRDWTIQGDDRTFYLFMCSNGTVSQWQSGGFGHFISYKSGDAFNTFVSGVSTFNTGNGSGGIHAFGNAPGSASTGFYTARSYSQIGSAINNGMWNAGQQSLTLPNGPDAGFWVGPVLVGDGTNVRGRMPGMYSIWHSTNATLNYDTATSVLGLTGVTLTLLLSQQSGSQNAAAYDTFGPWN